MSDKKPKFFKRVGNFLKGLNFKKTADVIGNLVTGNISGAIAAIQEDTELSAEDKAYAIKVMQMDIDEMASVTERWQADMASDSWLSKNVRPMSLIFLTVMTMILIYLDFFYGDEISVPSEWIELLKSLLLGVYIAYFGSRGLEKYKTIGKR